MKRERYGVRLIGCSGRETVWFRQRSTANQVRKAVRAHLANGGWSGARTLLAVADAAVNKKLPA